MDDKTGTKHKRIGSSGFNFENKYREMLYVTTHENQLNRFSNSINKISIYSIGNVSYLHCKQ